MRFEKTLPLRDGRTLRIRNAEPADAQALLELIVLTHSQTDYLLAYPDERRFTPEQEAEYLKGMCWKATVRSCFWRKLTVRSAAVWASTP